MTEVKWIRPYFVCGLLVTSKFLRGWKKFDTVLAKADFTNFEDKEFYTPKLGAMLCRNGGCYLCEVGKMFIIQDLDIKFRSNGIFKIKLYSQFIIKPY